jgi:hypothetical protein
MNPFENPRSWRRAVNDIVYFARAFLKLEPHPGQATWLRKSSGLENALVTGNRWGKSEIQAVKLLHRALFQIRPLDKDSKEYYRCVNVSITQDQAGIIFDKALGFIGRSGRFKALVREIRQTPFPHITLKNGSEIWARSTYNRGEHLLGHDFDYVNFDEAAYEPYGEWVVDGVIKLREPLSFRGLSEGVEGLPFRIARRPAPLREIHIVRGQIIPGGRHSTMHYSRRGATVCARYFAGHRP